MKKIKTISYILILFFVVWIVDKPLKFHCSNNSQNMIEFYEMPENSIDVLILGSSQAYVNINPIALWQDFGITSYILAGPIQPMWNTYFYLKEALKTQKPKLIVLDAYTTIINYNYDDGGIVINTYGMKWSLDKIEAICVSSPIKRWLDFLIPIFQEHVYYANLSPADFPKLTGVKHKQNMWLGSRCLIGSASCETPNINPSNSYLELHAKTEKYFRKTIELAVSHDIPILVVKSPYADFSEHHNSIYNSVGKISSEYGAKFINYNFQYERIGIDFSSDVADGAHLNYKGNSKFTKILAQDIKEMFDIPDRRDDMPYGIWNEESERFKIFLKTNGVEVDKIADALQK